jgi:hypothetical protein
MAFSLVCILVKIQNVVNLCDGLFSIVIIVLRAKEHFLSKPPVSREVSQFLSEDCAMMDIAHSLVSLSLGVINSSVDRASCRKVAEFVCKLAFLVCYKLHFGCKKSEKADDFLYLF